MALASWSHSRDGGESLEHGSGKGAHRLGREGGCGGKGSSCHGCPLLLGSREDVGLAPDERLAAREHLGDRA